MRLICPNCGAQYEVPDDVIPQGGRDVQCSNCAHTWFQPPAGEEAEPEDEAQPATEPPAPPPPPPPGGDEDSGAETVADALRDDRPDETGDAEDVSQEAEEAAPEPKTPKRRTIDPSVADVLREEAEHEAQMRARDGGQIESQPEFPLAEPAHDEGQAPPPQEPESSEPETEEERRAREARARMERLRGIDTSAGTEEMPDGAQMESAAAALSRRELLPDIEEINSTLRSTSDRDAAEATTVVAQPDLDRRSGFRLGFSTAALIAVVLLLIYVYAPQITALVPVLAPVLDAYVAVVTDLRGWLDDATSGLRAWVTATSQELNATVPAE